MNNSKKYERPRLDILEMKVEGGIALSGEAPSIGWDDNFGGGTIYYDDEE